MCAEEVEVVGAVLLTREGMRVGKVAKGLSCNTCLVEARSVFTSCEEVELFGWVSLLRNSCWFLGI